MMIGLALFPSESHDKTIFRKTELRFVVEYLIMLFSFPRGSGTIAVFHICGLMQTTFSVKDSLCANRLVNCREKLFSQILEHPQFPKHSTEYQEKLIVVLWMH
ncbi:hypothetical protein TNCV_2793811 [Trichonephila clavipes]|nr:hypothetical protein TNCV_2793811 [Trichonephila clavipes]